MLLYVPNAVLGIRSRSHQCSGVLEFAITENLFPSYTTCTSFRLCGFCGSHGSRGLHGLLGTHGIQASIIFRTFTSIKKIKKSFDLVTFVPALHKLFLQAT